MSGEEKIIDMYMFMHTSVLFHHINDATVNRTRRNNPQSCGKKLFHVILERVCTGGGGGGGGAFTVLIDINPMPGCTGDCIVTSYHLSCCVSAFYVTSDRIRCVTRRPDG